MLAAIWGPGPMLPTAAHCLAATVSLQLPRQRRALLVSAAPLLCQGQLTSKLLLQRQRKQGVAVEAQESNVAREKRGRSKDNWGGAERLGPPKPKTAHERRHQWVGLADAFYQQLKGWPVDVDLHEELKDGEVLGMRVDERLVKAVLHLLWTGGKRRADYFNDLSFLEAGKLMQTSPHLTELHSRDGDIRCSSEDAMRALSLFNWWQSRNPTTPQVMLLNPLIEVLSMGGLDNELRGIWETYKAHALHVAFLVGAMWKAFFDQGLYDEVLNVHREALENKWAIRPIASDYAVRAMVAKDAPLEQVWAFYKHVIESTGSRALLDPGYVVVLKAGVTVDQILSLRYKSVDLLLFRLIEALSLLGRKDEAAAIVSKVLNRQKPIQSEVLVWTLLVLVRHGFTEDAQMLVNLKSEEHNVRVDDALVSMLCGRLQNQWAGVRIYDLLSKLEGPHQTSLLVQAALIVRCYYPLKLTDKMWEAYQRGKQLKGTFSTEVIRYMMYSLTEADRVSQAEEVLADYYRDTDASVIARSTEVLGEAVYRGLCEMYLRAGQPDKVVELFEQMVLKKLHIRAHIPATWYDNLRKYGYNKQAEKLKSVATRIRRLKRVQYDRL
eukprot:TRINITY_DN10906_c0_g1_i1.p1 TRINITY_DN10906_c0_g1~~TRINITY_DN10906_c0_g1_i1.p1  ORF type:complete len:608 (+),score=45.01 TRINITY_DN10906_c0_g1_i1:289-2112(+)